MNFQCCDRVLLHFTATVRNMYHNITYHNWNHAFSVAQSAINLVYSLWDKFQPLERVGFVIAAICHDVDHPAVNNAFVMKTKHPLSALYATSVLENHHIYMTELILSKKENDIFASLDPEQRDWMRNYMRELIIATDLITHFPRLAQLKEMIGAKNFSWNDESDRLLGSKALMTLSDLNGAIKRWDVHEIASIKVFKEFFAQGDRELELGLEPPQMFVVREDFPINQTGFLNGIVKPLVDTMVEVVPALGEVQIQVWS